MKWTRKSEWGSDASTYRASEKGWTYTVLLPRKGGPWRLTGHGTGGRFLFREARTATDAKKMADDHNRGQK